MRACVWTWMKKKEERNKIRLDLNGKRRFILFIECRTHRLKDDWFCHELFCCCHCHCFCCSKCKLINCDFRVKTVKRHSWNVCGYSSLLCFFFLIFQTKWLIADYCFRLWVCMCERASEHAYEQTTTRPECFQCNGGENFRSIWLNPIVIFDRHIETCVVHSKSFFKIKSKSISTQPTTIWMDWEHQLGLEQNFKTQILRPISK